MRLSEPFLSINVYDVMTVAWRALSGLTFFYPESKHCYLRVYTVLIFFIAIIVFQIYKLNLIIVIILLWCTDIPQYRRRVYLDTTPNKNFRYAAAFQIKWWACMYILFRKYLVEVKGLSPWQPLTVKFLGIFSFRRKTLNYGYVFAWCVENMRWYSST